MDQASLGVSVWVDDAVPLLLQRVEDTTESFISCRVNTAIKDTVCVRHLTSGVDVKSDSTLTVVATILCILNVSFEGCRPARVLSDKDFA